MAFCVILTLHGMSWNKFWKNFPSVLFR